MSAQPVDFVYSADTEAAKRAVDELAQAMERQAGTADDAGASTEQLATHVDNLRTQTDELRDSQETNTRAHQSLAQQFGAAGVAAQSLAQRVQGVAGAVQALVSATGSDDHHAGAIASMAGLTAQGAAMGSMFGPGGTALGAIVGFTASILSMAAAQRTAAQAAEDHRHELEELAAANMAEADRAAFREEIRTGNVGAGRSESALAREREVARIELDEFEASWDELRERIRTTRETYAGVGRDVPADTERVLLAEVNALRRSRAERLDVITVIDAEIAGRRQLHELEATHTREAAAARARGGGGGGSRRSIEDILGTGAANNADMASIAAEAEARAAARAGEAKEREAQAFEEAEAKRVAQLNLDRELLAAEDERRHQRRLEHTRREAEASRRADEERRRRMEQEQRVLSDFGGAIGSVFGQAFGAAISGQESFDAALLKGTKQALIQYGTTMVAEGAGALLTAAGNIILNPPAAASKAIEGAGKIALGVGLGAAGAAIQPPAAAGDSNAKAERPQNQTPASSEGGGSHVTVLMNSPVIAGGHAEFGRLVNRGQRAAAQRFGRAA